MEEELKKALCRHIRVLQTTGDKSGTVYLYRLWHTMCIYVHYWTRLLTIIILLVKNACDYAESADIFIQLVTFHGWLLNSSLSNVYHIFLLL